MLAHVAQHQCLGFGDGDALVQQGEQARLGVHVADEVAHLFQRLGRGLDHHLDAVAEDVEFSVRHQGCDLDQRVCLEIQTGHLTVDPDQVFVHREHCIGSNATGRSEPDGSGTPGRAEARHAADATAT